MKENQSSIVTNADIAAPALIIKEAGGFMTDLNGNEIYFVLAKKRFPVNYSVATASSAIKDCMMELIR
jgi:fructose-1,6-bisphosphatase/inositol monophosphatase family enzyme